MEFKYVIALMSFDSFYTILALYQTRIRQLALRHDSQLAGAISVGAISAGTASADANSSGRG